MSYACFVKCVLYTKLSLNFQGHETTVDIELGGENFSCQGLMIIAKNYLDVYHYERWNAKVIGLVSFYF